MPKPFATPVERGILKPSHGGLQPVALRLPALIEREACKNLDGV
jgi:hypothetical protein